MSEYTEMACKGVIESLEKIKNEGELWSLTDAEKDQMDSLIVDFKFVDIFLRLQSYTEDRNLLIVSQEIQDFLASLGPQLYGVFSKGVHLPLLRYLILFYKLKIRDGYSFPEVINLSVERFEDNTGVIKFFVDILENIDAVRSNPFGSSLDLDPSIGQLVSLTLQILSKLIFTVWAYEVYCHGFLSSLNHSQISFFNHAISVAGHAAMIIFLHLPVHDDKAKQYWASTNISEITYLLYELLLKKIMPIEPSVRQIYVQVLQSIESEQSFTPPIFIEAGFAFFVRLCLDMLEVSNGVRIVPQMDTSQISIVREMFLFFGRRYSGKKELESLGTLPIEMHSVMLNVAISIFSSYGHKRDVALGEVVALDFPHLIPRISSLICQFNRVSFQYTLPRVDGLGFIDFLLDSLKEFLSHSANSQPSLVKNLLEVVAKELELMIQPFLRGVVAGDQQSIEHDRLKLLAEKMIGKAYEVEYIVDCHTIKDIPDWCLTPWLSGLIEEIEFLKTEVKKIKEVKACDSPTDNVTDASNVLASSQSENIPSVTDEMIGFEDVMLTLKNQLVRGTSQLDVISIVGNFGQGKTTVANKLFTDKLVVSRFDVRAKCLFRYGYELKELLVAILRNVAGKPTDITEVPEDELVDKLYKLLLQKRYLVLIDNVVDSATWDYLRPCFPDAKNGSRILLTTCSDEVANKARCISSPHHLRSLLHEEKWMLFHKKLSPQRILPPHVTHMVRTFVNKCSSPFKVVVLAGVVAQMTMMELELNVEGDKGAMLAFNYEHKKTYNEFLSKHQLALPLENIDDTSKGRIPSQLACIIGEDMVGFDDVMKILTDRLVKGTPTELDVISIIGMAGQGKTTVANKLLIDESVVSRFDVRAKCYVSQVYQRRQLLVAILSDACDKPTGLNEMPEAELADKLRKVLLRKRYLILIDNVWDTRAWDDLRSCFPDDNNGSRIILTSRLAEVAEFARCSSSPYHLRLLTDEESWILFRKRVFLQESCPPDLIDVGQEIVNKCGRLPLSIVLVAGVLTRKMTKWKQVAEDVGSHIHADSKHIIEFSYKSLPHFLKPCFLYFGAFSEDKEIQVPKLMKLWVAEGLVVRQEERCLVDIAEDHLNELIRRNMVMATKKGSLGKIKACSVHDLLLEFCKEKTQEEKFLQCIYRDMRHVGWYQTVLIRRLSFYSKQHDLPRQLPSCSNVHTALFGMVGEDVVPSDENLVSFSIRNFRCLRVLDSEFITSDSFPIELSQLRYLALRTVDASIPPSIANLRNLQTLVVKGLGSELSLPHSLCKMVKLTHLHIRDRASFDLHNLKRFLESPSELGNLETFSTPAFSSGADAQRVLRKTPNLRKLRCIFSGSWGFSEEQKKECNQFPKLQHLTKLESLKVFCFHCPERSPCEFNFPSDLKKLTLSGFRLPWCEIRAISTLPNLAILKLRSDAFDGEEWEVTDEQFSQLKVLKLENISFARWSILEDAFSSLEKLILHRCGRLVEIPSEFGYLNCLQSIEVKSCQESVVNSARDVEKVQVSEMGNSIFKLFIY